MMHHSTKTTKIHEAAKKEGNLQVLRALKKGTWNNKFLEIEKEKNKAPGN